MYQKGNATLWLLLLLGLGGAAYWTWQHRYVLPVTSTLAGKPITVPVDMYTATWCGVCKMAKQSMQAMGIPYTEHVVDLSPDAERDFEALGTGGVPTLLIGEPQQVMVGYDEGHLIDIYQKAGGTIPNPVR